jgi:hypothetical protein
MAGMMVCAVVMYVTEDHESKLLMPRFIPKHFAGVNDSGVRYSALSQKSLSFTPGFSPVMDEARDETNRFNGLLFIAKED